MEPTTSMLGSIARSVAASRPRSQLRSVLRTPSSPISRSEREPDRVTTAIESRLGLVSGPAAIRCGTPSSSTPETCGAKGSSDTTSRVLRLATITRGPSGVRTTAGARGQSPTGCLTSSLSPPSSTTSAAGRAPAR